jgi:hypothetical protein
LIAERDPETYALVRWVFGAVGTDGIEAHKWYKAKDGKLVFADNAATREADRVIAEQAAATKKSGGVA